MAIMEDKSAASLKQIVFRGGQKPLWKILISQIFKIKRLFDSKNRVNEIFCLAKAADSVDVVAIPQFRLMF